MAKRISGVSVNWDLLTGKVHADRKAAFLAFKSKTDKHHKRVASYPAELQKIDWDYYNSRIAIPGLVSSFQKSYEALKIPYPSDQGALSKVDKNGTDFRQWAKNREAELNKRVQTIIEDLKNKERELPNSQMTIEEYLIIHPEDNIDPEKPVPWIDRA